MKIVAKPVEAITWTSLDGEVRPLRFKLKEGDRITVIKVERVVKVERTQRAGENALVFTCESHLRGEQRLYELRYTLGNCMWVLYKI